MDLSAPVAAERRVAVVRTPRTRFGGHASHGEINRGLERPLAHSIAPASETRKSSWQAPVRGCRACLTRRPNGINLGKSEAPATTRALVEDPCRIHPERASGDASVSPGSHRRPCAIVIRSRPAMRWLVPFLGIEAEPVLPRGNFLDGQGRPEGLERQAPTAARSDSVDVGIQGLGFDELRRGVALRVTRDNVGPLRVQRGSQPPIPQTCRSNLCTPTASPARCVMRSR